MTRIDFYILPAEGGTDPVVAAARLCDKAVSAGHTLYALCPDAARLQREPPKAPLPQVLLGDGEPPEGWQDVLLNLGTAVPVFFSRFDRLLEIVPGDADSRAQCRERFKFYRDRGYELRSFEQNSEGGWTAKA